MVEDLKQRALDYHEYPTPGKIGVAITKPAETVSDLSLAYSPGVAEPVRAIHENPDDVYKYTAKGNLVAVVTNGSAILGLGNLGPLASKPVMEGKALLFKHYADVDSIDIEIDSESPQAFIDTVIRIANTFGGINLEDIKAPECFEIETALIERCTVPVFHDDQHGTAIVTVAAILNALDVAGKNLSDTKIVCLGAGAAAIACCKLLVSCDFNIKNISMLDSKGVIHSGRSDLNEYKAAFAMNTDDRTLDDVIDGADIFIGLSGPDLLSVDQLKKMSKNPIVFACSNPDPEIKPDIAKKERPDIIMATGRSDYPNQVNNVLCFPFIFRGTLDVRAKIINNEMKIAAVEALRNIAKKEVSADIAAYYGEQELKFGSEYIIPKPMDARLLQEVSAAVARAAVDSGVAQLPLPDKYK